MNFISSDVNDSLEKAETLLQTYKSSRQRKENDSKISELMRDLRNSIRSIEWDLEDLQVRLYK